MLTGVEWGAIGLSILIAYGMIKGLQESNQRDKLRQQEVNIRLNTQEQFILKQIHYDAIDALVGLGTKKKQAKSMVEELAKQRQYTSVEQIIVDAYRWRQS